MVNAARKIGATAVPLNYRLSPEEAAYVIDHCDATIVFVDAELAPMFGGSGRTSRRSSTPRVRRRGAEGWPSPRPVAAAPQPPSRPRSSPARR